jgi:hypothetical protein
MCWAGERNTTEELEKLCNGRMVVVMEELQLIIIVFKKIYKMNTEYVDGKMIMIFGNKFLVM